MILFSSLTSHQFNNVFLGLLKDHVHMLRLVLLELSLEEAAAVLVLAKLIDLALHILQLEIGVASAVCKLVSLSIVGAKPEGLTISALSAPLLDHPRLTVLSIVASAGVTAHRPVWLIALVVVTITRSLIHGKTIPGWWWAAHVHVVHTVDKG